MLKWRGAHENVTKTHSMLESTYGMIWLRPVMVIATDLVAIVPTAGEWAATCVVIVDDEVPPARVRLDRILEVVACSPTFWRLVAHAVDDYHRVTARAPA